MTIYLALGFLIVATFAPMVYRLATPIPATDLQAIEVFVKDRDQTLVSLRKYRIGGPAVPGGRSIYSQVGRPYRVSARSGDGSLWNHDVAVVGTDQLGKPKLQERVSGFWSPIIQ